MNYTLSQLRIYLKITQRSSITKAAEDLHLTQPAVSIQLKNFQKQFNYPLTEIINKKLYVTDFGKEIAIAAENIINEIDNINYRLESYKNQLAGHLKISIVSTGQYIMPYFLAEFMKKNFAVDLTMDVTNKSKVIKSLEQNEIDFALVSILPENLSLNKFDLLENELYLVGNKEMKLKKGVEQKKVLEELPLILREQGSGTRQTMERFLNKQKFMIRKKMELTTNEAVKQAVMAGLGYSIMPLIGIRNEIDAGLIKIIPINGLPIKTIWRLIWLKEKKLSPVADAFLKYLYQEKDNIIKNNFQHSLKQKH